ncbi:DUF4190 domain-containing protein [Cellulomonas sp.]|uniref:DUF4190 domain-containing protein n=1 Tax=Cellulomonas sp. TaxID=40001 RepID=UPI003BAAC453
MSEQTGHEPSGTPFALPGGPRPAVDVARVVDEPRSSAEATSPYAPPSTGAASPFGPPAAPQPFLPAPLYGQPGPYAQPGMYPPAAAYGQAAPYAQPPAYGSPAPYGAPQPSYGGPAAYGGPQPYGTPGASGPFFGYGGVVEPPTDGLAIASLVTSIAGLLVLGGAPGPVGVGLGIGALRRIRRRGTKGRGMAIAGVVVGAVSTLVCIGWVWLAVWASSGPPGVVGDFAYGDELPDYTLRSDLVVGDCLGEYPNSWDLGTADPVGCGEAHALEIVAVLPLSGPVDASADPADAGFDRAFEQCAEQIERAAPGLLDEWTVWTDVSFPHPGDWSEGATTAYCAVATDSPSLRGSVLDGSVTGPE